jgi:cell filamentation protein, protein adenylyltransferase
MRSGRFVKQLEGYRAFEPAKLPPTDPPLHLDTELVRLLSDADRNLGKLDGVASILPNPELFVAMYVRQEAVLSSQIEGTQSTLDDVLQFELDAKGENRPKDVAEVVNYVKAMNHGLKRLPALPVSKRLIREIHEVLLTDVRGGKREPGQFRKSQNWIGPEGSTLQTATFVPPPVHVMNDALDALERFLHDHTLPVLIHCGLVHAQFETIHPFLDGNGRVGRLLITFLLCERQVLQRPLLYLSHYLKRNRAEYYDRLTAIREKGDWEAWLSFFLRGVSEVSLQATDTARRILALRDEHRAIIKKHIGGANGYELLDHLYQNPITTVKLVASWLDCTFTSANKLVTKFERLGLLTETTGQSRSRRYRYSPYLDLFPAAAAAIVVPAAPPAAASTGVSKSRSRGMV